MSDPNPDGIDRLAAKVARVMNTIDDVPKNGTNDYHGYQYATDDDVMGKVRPAMAEHNLIALTDLVDRSIDRFGSEENGYTLHTRVTLEITLVDADSGQSRTITWEGEAQDTQDKGLYKAYTSGIKYWALKTFLLSADTDVETDDIAGERPDGSAGKREPTDEQLDYARDLADEPVWSDAESDDLHSKIDSAGRSELSNLIDDMKEAVAERENSSAGNGQSQNGEAGDLVNTVNNEVPSKLRSLAMQAGQAMPEGEVDTFVTLLKTTDMPDLADVIEEHHERYC